MKRKRVIITGGHHNSALVVAEELRSRGYEIIWLGHKYTMRGDKNPGAEYQEVTRAGFKFIELKAAKIHRSLNITNLIRFPLGFIQAFFHLLHLRPCLIFSFGGYLAVPVVFYGWLLGIPIVTHEQTVVYGLANRIIEVFARKIFVSWEASLKHFSSKKAVFVGLPLRPSVFAKQKNGFNFKNKLPTIYIHGGKQGSHVVNQAVESALSELLEKYNIIHQCGSTSLHDDLSRLKNIRNQLSAKLRQRYAVQDYFFLDKIGQVFAAADLVVGRAGAHTIYEVAALGKPALFIPIPWSSLGEQNKNAQILVRAGTAEVLPQEELSGSSLLQLVNQMIIDLDQYRKNAVKAKKLVKLDAVERIADLVEEVLG